MTEHRGLRRIRNSSAAGLFVSLAALPINAVTGLHIGYFAGVGLVGSYVVLAASALTLDRVGSASSKVDDTKPKPRYDLLAEAARALEMQGPQRTFSRDTGLIEISDLYVQKYGVGFDAEQADVVQRAVRSATSEPNKLATLGRITVVMRPLDGAQLDILVNATWTTGHLSSGRMMPHQLIECLREPSYLETLSPAGSDAAGQLATRLEAAFNAAEFSLHDPSTSTTHHDGAPLRLDKDGGTFGR